MLSLRPETRLSQARVAAEKGRGRKRDAEVRTPNLMCVKKKKERQFLGGKKRRFFQIFGLIKPATNTQSDSCQPRGELVTPQILQAMSIPLGLTQQLWASLFLGLCDIIGLAFASSMLNLYVQGSQLSSFGGGGPNCAPIVLIFALVYLAAGVQTTLFQVARATTLNQSTASSNFAESIISVVHIVASSLLIYVSQQPFYPALGQYFFQPNTPCPYSSAYPAPGVTCTSDFCIAAVIFGVMMMVVSIWRAVVDWPPAARAQGLTLVGFSLKMLFISPFTGLFILLLPSSIFLMLGHLMKLIAWIVGPQGPFRNILFLREYPHQEMHNMATPNLTQPIVVAVDVIPVARVVEEDRKGYDVYVGNPLTA